MSGNSRRVVEHALVISKKEEKTDESGGSNNVEQLGVKNRSTSMMLPRKIDREDVKTIKSRCKKSNNVFIYR